MKNKQYSDDDGRRIADMSNIKVNLLDYWFAPKRRSFKERNKGMMVEEPVLNDQLPLPPPTKEETRSMMWQAMLWSLLIALVFIAGAALFILFCIHIWFK